MADFLNDLKGKWDSARSKAKETIDEAIPADNVNKLDELRNKGIKSFSKALVEAVDFTPASMRGQEWAKQQKAQREGLVETAADIALPNQYDIIPGMGSIKKVENAAAKLAKDVNVVEATRKGFEMLDKPVLKTIEEKAADKLPGAFGKVLVEEAKKPKIGKVILK